MVLEVEYDSIWNFLDKNRFSTKVIKNGISHEIFFHDLNTDLHNNDCFANLYDESNDSNYYDEPHYDKYAGTYAQDVAGFSDEEIDIIFDGEPDAYWNID